MFIFARYCIKFRRYPIPNIIWENKKLTIIVDKMNGCDLVPVVKTLEDKRISLFEIILISKEYSKKGVNKTLRIKNK